MTITAPRTAVALLDPIGPPPVPVGGSLGTDLARVTDPGERWRISVGRFLLGYDAAGTREAYGRDLSQWAVFCEGLGVDPLLAGRGVVSAWQQVLIAQGRARATLARKVSTLAAFFAFAVDEDLLARSPVRGRRPKAGDDPTSTGLTEPEAAALLDTAIADGLRSAVLIGLLYLCGLRVSEALAVRVEDLGHERGFRIARVTRKGGKVGIVPLPAELAQQLDAFIAGQSTGPVIRTRSGRPMARKEAWVLVRRLGRAAGLPQAATLHPHDLRHAHATISLDAGVPLRDVQDSLGHASPVTTRRYDRARARVDRHPGSVLAGRLAPYREGHDHTAHGQTGVSAGR